MAGSMRRSSYVELMSNKVALATRPELRVKHRLAVETQKRVDLRAVYEAEKKETNRKARAELLKRNDSVAAKVHRRFNSFDDSNGRRQGDRGSSSGLPIGLRSRGAVSEGEDDSTRQRRVRKRQPHLKKSNGGSWHRTESYSTSTGSGESGSGKYSTGFLPSVHGGNASALQRRKEYLPEADDDRSETSSWTRWHRRNRVNFNSSSLRFSERFSDTPSGPMSTESTTQRLAHLLGIVQGLADAPGHYGAVLKIFFREIQRAAYADFDDDTFTAAVIDAGASRQRPQHSSIANGHVSHRVTTASIGSGTGRSGQSKAPVLPFQSLYLSDCESTTITIQHALARLRFFLQQKDFKDLDPGRCLRQVVFTAWGQYTVMMQHEYAERLRKLRLRIWFNGMRRRLLSKRRTSAQSQKATLEYKVQKIRSQQVSLKNKVLWNEVTVGRHRHFENQTKASSGGQVFNEGHDRQVLVVRHANTSTASVATGTDLHSRDDVPAAIVQADESKNEDEKNLAVTTDTGGDSLSPSLSTSDTPNWGHPTTIDPSVSSEDQDCRALSPSAQVSPNDSCAALRAVATREGIDRTVRIVLKFLDSLLGEYIAALQEERGPRREVTINDVIQNFKGCSLGEINSFQVWVRHYDPSLKDLRSNFTQTGAESTANAGTQGGLSLDPNGSPLDEDASRSGSADDPLSSTDSLLKFHVPLSEAQVLGRNVRVRHDSRNASSFEDLRAGKNVNVASDLAPTLDGALMNIACVRMYIADIFSFKASSDAAQDLAGGARQTLPRLVSAYFLALQPSTDADARETRMDLAAQALRLRRLFENSVLQYGRRKYENHDVRCFGQMANILTGPAFGPPSVDLLLHLFRFRNYGCVVDHPDIDHTLNESLRGIATGNLPWTPQETLRRFEFAFQRFFLTRADAKATWESMGIGGVRKIFNNQLQQHEGKSFGGTMRGVSTKDVMRLFSDLWSEAYSTVLARTQSAASSCCGRIWSDGTALTKLCVDSISMLAPDLEYTDGSSTDGVSSPPPPVVVAGSPTGVDNANDIVEMEARQMAMRAAASDRIFSYAHLLHLISARILSLRHHQREQWQRRHLLRFPAVRANTMSSEDDDYLIEELLVSSGNDGAGTAFKRSRRVLFDSFMAYMCFGHYMNHTVRASSRAVDVLTLTEEEQAQSDLDQQELGLASSDEEDGNLLPKTHHLVDEVLEKLGSKSKKSKATIAKDTAGPKPHYNAKQKAELKKMKAQATQHAKDLYMLDPDVVINAKRRQKRRRRRRYRQREAQQALAKKLAASAKSIHIEQLKERMSLGRLLKFFRETGLMAPSKASDGKNAGEASVAGESSGPTTTTRSDNDDEDFISEEALLRIIELVANDAVSEGETSCGEPGMMRQAAHRHRENMSVHHIDFYSVILYLALHVYQCSLRDLVGRMLRFHAANYPDFHHPHPQLRAVRHEANVAASSKNEPMRRSPRRIGRESSAQARATLVAQRVLDVAARAEAIAAKERKSAIRPPFESMGMGKVFCAPVYPQQIRPPFNQAAYFEPQKVQLGAVRRDASDEKDRRAKHEVNNQSIGHEEDSATIGITAESNANMVLIHLHEMHFNVLHQDWKDEPLPLLLRLRDIFHRHAFRTPLLDATIASFGESASEPVELDVDNLQEAELTKDANHNAVLSAQVVSSFRPAPKSLRLLDIRRHVLSIAVAHSVSPLVLRDLILEEVQEQRVLSQRQDSI